MHTQVRSFVTLGHVQKEKCGRAALVHLTELLLNKKNSHSIHAFLSHSFSSIHENNLRRLFRLCKNTHFRCDLLFFSLHSRRSGCELLMAHASRVFKGALGCGRLSYRLFDKAERAVELFLAGHCDRINVNYFMASATSS